MNAGLLTAAVLVLSSAIAAFTVWFTVRIVNSCGKLRMRHWRGMGLAVLLAYPLSFGPACWIADRTNAKTGTISAAYFPMIWLANRSPRVGASTSSYASLGAGKWSVPSFIDDEFSWTLSGPSQMLRFHVTISCDFSSPAEVEESGISDIETEAPACESPTGIQPHSRGQ
jgi:hypothetical protein